MLEYTFDVLHIMCKYRWVHLWTLPQSSPQLSLCGRYPKHEILSFCCKWLIVSEKKDRLWGGNTGRHKIDIPDFFKCGKPKALGSEVSSPTFHSVSTRVANQARLISHSCSAEQARSESEWWECLLLIPHTTPWALMWPLPLFLHNLVQSDSCEGVRLLLPAHGIPFRLTPVRWAGRKAGRLSSPALPLHSDSPLMTPLA